MEEEGRPRPKKKVASGFKWKDQASTSTKEDGYSEHVGLDRGYKERGDRDKRRNREREREREYERDTDRRRDAGEERSNSRLSPLPPLPPSSNQKETTEVDERVREKFGDVKPSSYRNTGSSTAGTGPASIEDKFGAGAGASTSTAIARGGDDDGSKKKKEKATKDKKPKIAPTSEPMIVVNVNDRLGTKAAIPCLASDPISMSCICPPFQSIFPFPFVLLHYQIVSLTHPVLS